MIQEIAEILPMSKPTKPVLKAERLIVVVASPGPGCRRVVDSPPGSPILAG
jgi:hypothetical protein